MKTRETLLAVETWTFLRSEALVPTDARVDPATREEEVFGVPGGQVETYGYDAANELTSIAYSGTGIPASSQITYGYDPVGRATGVWDAWARIGLPTAMAGPATYNADNQLTNWNGTVNTYDLIGNLAAAGTQTYTWNARDKLTATSGGAASFIYDGLGRRIKKVVSGTTSSSTTDRTRCRSRTTAARSRQTS